MHTHNIQVEAASSPCTCVCVCVPSVCVWCLPESTNDRKNVPLNTEKRPFNRKKAGGRCSCARFSLIYEQPAGYTYTCPANTTTYYSIQPSTSKHLLQSGEEMIASLSPPANISALHCTTLYYSAYAPTENERERERERCSNGRRCGRRRRRKGQSTPFQGRFSYFL